MENLDLLVRGVAMQSSGGVPGGLGFSRSVSFQGLELLWVVFIATIVLAVMSVTRGVSVMTWGWSKSGSHVRVRVQSFASLADGAIVTAGGMFSAEIVHSSSTDSCSEDADESPVSERAEMLFYFDEKGASLMAHTTKHTARLPPPSVKHVTRPVVPELLLLEPVPTPGSVPRREGIQWNTNVDSLLPVTPVVCTVPSLPSPVVRNTSPFDFDPLLKLRIRDAVVSNGSAYQSLPTPVPIQSSDAVTTLKNDVVRVWDSDTRTMTKSVHLEQRSAVATAFDVNWGSQVTAIARENSALSIANLDTGAYKQCYRTQQPIVQAIHLQSPNLLYTGASSNPGSAVSLYDLRSSTRELAVTLPTAVTIYNIQSRGSELYIQDESNSVATHDLRVLRSSPLSRKATTEVESSKNRWWDMETVSSEEDDVDEDDFFDCLPPSEEQTSASFNMSRSFVRAVSFNFSSTKA
jgi:hypothetical protein